METRASEALSDLIRALDRAVDSSDGSSCCCEVKKALAAAVGPGTDLLEPRFLAPDPERYARHLLHRDPEGRYSAVVMVWGRGQGTPLHDHAGKWCVECVYRGRIRVTSYALEEEGHGDGRGFRFRMEREVLNGTGEAGALIPPFEYHTIENAGAEPAVTIHVYRRELTWCHAFYPAGDGTHHRIRRELGYSS